MPMCPHCKNQVTGEKDISVKRMVTYWSNEVDVIYCTNCDAILGVD